MLDIKRIVDEKEKVKEGLLKRMSASDFDLDEIIKTYDKKQELQQKYDKLRAEQKSHNDDMAKLEKGSDEFMKKVEELKTLSAKVKELDEKVSKQEEKLQEMVEVLPNVPDEDVPAGDKEANEVIKTYQEPKEFDFEIKDHIELGEKLDMLDFEKAAKIAGSQFALYKNDGARLEWALINYFIDEHIQDGYQMVLPPHLLSEETAYAAGQLPKFKDDVYWTQDGNCLLPTAETALAGYFMNEILDEDELPKKIFAYTPCYRREAGSYRANERGLMRMHQFNKVEMFQFTTQEQSEEAFEELVEKGEKLVEKLGLHYQTSKLAAGDCSAGMARTYDIEVFLPKLEVYYEVSSVSNAKDYQTRRGNMRYRPADGGKPKYMHSLNGSGLATSRLVVAIMETYQNEDGSITVPEVLRSYMGKDKIEK
jgi:seryl-tRNA synthetase